MKRPPTSIRFILLSLMVISYTMSVVFTFSPYFTFYHRSAFQMQVNTFKPEELRVLLLSISEFENIKWTETNKEFEHQGKMYDVAKIEHNANGYRIYCENDILEDLLINLLKSTGKSKCKMMPVIQFFEPVTGFRCRDFLTDYSKSTLLFKDTYLSILLELITPPPRFF